MPKGVRNMKNLIKTSCILIATLLLMMTAAPAIQAATTKGTDGASGSGADLGSKSISDILKKPSSMSGQDAKKVEEISSGVLSIFTSIGIVVSVVMLAVLGIKYMIGSAEEKADYKKDLIPYFVGAVLLFGITSFIKIISALGTSIGNT